MMMRLKKGDTVMLIAGKNKGKSAKITQAFPAIKRVVVEGLNVATKHMKSGKSGEKGQKIEFSSPVNVSNVMLVCPKCSKTTRVGMKKLEKDGQAKNVRVCKKCKETLE